MNGTIRLVLGAVGIRVKRPRRVSLKWGRLADRSQRRRLADHLYDVTPNRPFHYRDAVERVEKRVVLRCKSPDTECYSAMRRDPRFVQMGRGYFEKVAQ